MGHSVINVILFPSCQAKVSLEKTGDIPFCVLNENEQAVSKGSTNIKGYKLWGWTQTTALVGQVHCVLEEAGPCKEKSGSKQRANKV